MPEHDAEHSRQSRRARAVPARQPFSAAKHIKRGLELQRLERLPWPRDLFGNYASIAELMAEAAAPSSPEMYRNDLCPCGCRREHKNNVSQTIRSAYGHSFNVIYFWSNACKSKWNREGTEASSLPSLPDKHKKPMRNFAR
jgi:hypothetical protein